MKKLVLKIFLCLVIISCKAQKNTVNTVLNEEENFVLAYKTSVLFGCINEATQGSFNEFSKENNDLGLAVPTAVLQHAETKKAAEFGALLSKGIIPSGYADYEGRKPIFSNCVAYSFSKETDSIARAEYNLKKQH